jgi:hypothetical protein
MRLGSASAVQVSGGRIQRATVDSTAAIAVMDTLAKRGRWVGRVWGRHFGNAIRRNTELSQSLRSAFPRMVFALVPVFAALVALVYRARRRRYPQHLAFALHLHAFLFLAMTVMLARRLTTIAPLRAVILLGGLGLIVAYSVQALRRVYGGSRAGAISRAVVITLAYAVTFVVVMILMIGLIVLLQF